MNDLPAKAYAFVNVFGYYELYINGNKVGNDILSPAVSDYSKQSLFVTYDISPYLRRGKNSKTFWLFREQLIEKDVIMGLFKIFNETLDAAGVFANEDKMIDAPDTSGLKHRANEIPTKKTSILKRQGQRHTSGK